MWDPLVRQRPTCLPSHLDQGYWAVLGFKNNFSRYDLESNRP